MVLLFCLLTLNFLFHWDSSSVQSRYFKVPFEPEMRSKQTQRPQAKICQNISDPDLDSRHDSTAGGLSPTGPIRSGLRSRTHILVRCVFTRMLQKQPLPFLSIRYLRCRCSGCFHFPSNARQLLQLLRFATRACFGF